MADNQTKTDQIHGQLPQFWKTRQNPNWNAIISAIGERDQELSELIQEVRKQFFVNTSIRPFIDRLGANVKVARPRLIGMNDATLRKFIPILAYQPKQVKLVIDLLLDLFFSKEATTAFLQTSATAPYALQDGWELEYAVDIFKSELITFNASDFVDITAATAEEVVSVINRQATDSFAVVFDDRILKAKFVRIFTNTIGSKGSIEIIGGRSIIGLQPQGYLTASGSGTNTAWTIVKVGETMEFTHTAGADPGLASVQVGDIVAIQMSSIAAPTTVTNSGSFVVTEVDISTSTFKFENLFGEAGTFTHTPTGDEFVSFLRPGRVVVFTNTTRAVSWEVTPGEIIVEFPATPPVVRRNLIGSAHINGAINTVESRDSTTTMTIDDADDWPASGGQFVLQRLEEIDSIIPLESVTLTHQFNCRFNKQAIYTYTGKTGNQITGISPDLPDVATTFERTISTATRDAFGTVTVTTTAAHGFSVGESARVEGTTPGPVVSPDGTFTILSTPTTTTFTYLHGGDAGTATGGVTRIERIGMANTGTRAYLTKAVTNTGIFGPIMWDLNASFVLSALTSTIQEDIKAGNTVKIITIATPNNVPNEEGFLIFDFGTERQEGPVRYLFKPSDGSISIDPAFVFQFNHDINSSITVIRRRGAHIMSRLGTEYGAYITDPAVARAVLQDVIRDVKSVGIFIDFLIRYPNQLYATLDVYGSGSSSLHPVTSS